MFIGRILAVVRTQNDIKFVPTLGFFSSRLFEGAVMVWGFGKYGM